MSVDLPISPRSCFSLRTSVQYPREHLKMDHQLCLSWSQHQSTLIGVFENLLGNESLSDCTLAAEGKFLKAHKLVLSSTICFIYLNWRQGKSDIWRNILRPITFQTQVVSSFSLAKVGSLWKSADFIFLTFVYVFIRLNLNIKINGVPG